MWGHERGDGSVRGVGKLLRRLGETRLAPLVGDPDPPAPTVRERALVRVAYLLGGFVASVRDAVRVLSATATLAAGLVLVLLALYLVAALVVVSLTDAPFPPLGLPHAVAALLAVAVIARAFLRE